MTEPRVFIVRHSQSQYNAEGRWAGWTDTPLTDQGRHEAAAAAERLKPLNLHAVLTSDLTRAHTGGRIIADILNIPLLPSDPRLRERNAGHWQGRLVAELEHDPHYQAWRNSPRNPLPGGETYPDFLERITAAAADATKLSQQRNANLLVVCHDGVLQALDQHYHIHKYPYSVLDGFHLPAQAPL